MYSKSKYVVGEVSGIMVAIVIPEVLSHSDLLPVFDQNTIRSAGFCFYLEADVQVYGDSFGLKVISRPDDAHFVGRAMSHPKYVT